MSLRRYHVHVPFGALHAHYLPLFLKEHLNPEISLDYNMLESYGPDDFRSVAEQLKAEGLTVTLHAPFMDLRPGALDPDVRRISRKRIDDVLALAPCFSPLAIVCHPSFDKRYYVSTEALWLTHSINTWSYFAQRAEELATTILLENVYEQEPGIFRRLFDAVASPHLRFCFDTGHYNVFSQVGLDVWLLTLGDYLEEVHLHDNHGKVDEHGYLGAGTFPFRDFFILLKNQDLHPLFTLEAHREADLWQSINALEKFSLAGDIAW